MSRLCRKIDELGEDLSLHKKQHPPPLPSNNKIIDSHKLLLLEHKGLKEKGRPLMDSIGKHSFQSPCEHEEGFVQKLKYFDGLLKKTKVKPS